MQTVVIGIYFFFLVTRRIESPWIGHFGFTFPPWIPLVMKHLLHEYQVLRTSLRRLLTTMPTSLAFDIVCTMYV